jgi:hypothetical protein
MAGDAIYQEGGQQQEQQEQQEQQSVSVASSMPQSSAVGSGHSDNGSSDHRIIYGVHRDGSLTLTKDHLPAYEDLLFSLISNNNGKLRFVDVLELVGGPPHKNILYKALASLARQGKIERIRGIGKKRIEFYYYDKKKLKKSLPSASVSFVSR